MLRPPSLFALAVLALLLPQEPARAADDQPAKPAPLDVFEQRIMPIFRSPKPSSCVQCHLAAVDLKDYILPSHEQTFVSLRDQGLIDLDDPGKSKILTLIQMGRKDVDEGAKLIHQATRKAEYEAFAAWIEACCADPRLRDLPAPSGTEPAQPSRPEAVIRHARKSRVVDSFARNVWSQRMRCFPCHTPHELDQTNPQHRKAIKRYNEFKRKHSDRFAQRMDIFRQTPEATMQYLIERSRNVPPGELPLLNLDNPRRSLLILKPTSKVPKKREDGSFAKPAYLEPVSHMGGLKMHVDDQSYKAFVAWIQDYARVVGDRYTSVADLPMDNWYPSKHVLLVRDAPDAWPDRARVQFFIHRWNVHGASWAPQPIAFTQGSLTPRRIVAGALFLLRSAGAEQAEAWDRKDATLPPGRYLIKVYVDTAGRLADDPTAMLGQQSFYGQTEIEAHWGQGFRQAQRISGELLR